jgi:TM2 domain-containing membrane protein YozV
MGEDFEFEKRNPPLAACLSIIPGLGQVYNGQKGKGAAILVIFIFVGFCLAYSVIPIVVMFLIWIYSIADAFLTAKKINKAEVNYEE